MREQRQQGGVAQRDLLDEALRDALRPDGGGEGGDGPAPGEEQQARTAWEQERSLTQELMEAVSGSANLNLAYKRVKANGGSAGVDGMTVDGLRGWIAAKREALIASLLDGSYRPQPVRGVRIPKPGGGERQLGIPTVVDRLVQQAIAQVLEPILDPGFSASSFGFRPGRSAHDALRQAREYVAEGHEIVVDLDLEKFFEGGSQVSPSISACRRLASAPFGTGFDRVNHDILMARLARRVGDKRLLRIVRRFLQAGMMQDGVCIERQEGTPQGGPLSPMLANLLLDDLDKELERRGHRFCRYADDCNIYVRSQAAGERVMASVTAFLEGRLKLRVNRQKSAVAWVGERQFLGHRLGKGGSLGIGRKSLDRAKDKLREITRRNRGIPVERMVEAANRFLVGWVAYYRHTRSRSMLRELDGWLRRKMRCVRLKQCKHPSSIAAFLERGGVEQGAARRVASSGKGWWRLTATEQAQRAMSKDWFEAIGLVSAARQHAALNAVGNRRGT